MAHRALNAGSMSIGTNHMCAVDRLNTLFCWGLNTRGQVGVSTMISERAPTSPFATSVVSVAAGAEHTLVALSAPTGTLPGNLLVFGRNNFDQLGLGSGPLSGASVVRPSIIPGLIVSRLGSGYGIEAGKEHSCATTATGLQCWGRDDQGQLGNSSMFSSQTSPALVVPPAMTVGPYIGLSGLSLDEKSSCAISAAGSLHCWGEGKDYRLGTGTRDDEQVPMSVPGL